MTFLPVSIAPTGRTGGVRAARHRVPTSSCSGGIAGFFWSPGQLQIALQGGDSVIARPCLILLQRDRSE
ncbi:hypothetical protein [Komagataeibacter kakiaceti]|uniref:hypothetical protein n=1 Tax=Komagataeibacter kakiaceti TaxID=943261 RepID=UPI000A517221|nr:hypothetical protein [Komagataeibacter kakiaceti]